ncbi:aminotransferase class IV [Tautonia marina]|uniref:aminotransferase class IV n=1 Tax=Tautonia marina TaxID=2653855 RepID=UPI00126057DE|nr:aminotransferase class IV [Tautonia marina]
MIWVRGEIVPDEALRISVFDRTFEHGLGLFETLRTWNGRATLLERHLTRLQGWADALGLPMRPEELPDHGAVEALREAEGRTGDCSLRIVLSGGFDEGRPGTIWMRTRALPPPIPDAGLSVCSQWRVAPEDRLMQAKTLNYWSRRIAFEEAQRLGFDENLSRDESGAILEGSRSNLFLVERGELVTPGVVRSQGSSAPFLPGIMRGVIMERANTLGMTLHEEASVTIDRMIAAEECFLTNAGRGIMPVARFDPEGVTGPERGRRYNTPGPVTQGLMTDLNAWLRSEDAR